MFALTLENERQSEVAVEDIVLVKLLTGLATKFDTDCPKIEDVAQLVIWMSSIPNSKGARAHVTEAFVIPLLDQA